MASGRLRMQDGTRLNTVTGTQYINGIWLILRCGIKGHKADRTLLDQLIRSSQWRYWNQHCDLTKALADIF